MGLAFEMAGVVLNSACASSSFSDMLLVGCFHYHVLPTRPEPPPPPKCGPWLILNNDLSLCVVQGGHMFTGNLSLSPSAGWTNVYRQPEPV